MIFGCIVNVICDVRLHEVALYIYISEVTF